MTTLRTATLTLCAMLLLPAAVRAQSFSAGSDGFHGALVVPADTTETVTLPEDGILRYTQVTVAAGATLRFTRNARNTPVHVLSSGPIVIDGTIDLKGTAGSSVAGGPGGPGGFDGGAPGVGSAPGDGLGPGGGKGGTPSTGAPSEVGHGAHATRDRPNDGAVYGASTLIPLIGGSGGGGTTNGFGGGGGGGAILLASDVSVTIGATGRVLALGAPRVDFGRTNEGGCGSGGAIRIVAPQVLGTGQLQALGGEFSITFLGSRSGGSGRIRIDTLDRASVALSSSPAATLGSLMLAVPSVVQRLDIVHCAGEDIPVGSGPVTVVLPEIAPAQQTITVRASGFVGTVPIRVRLVPETGVATTIDTSIDMGLGDPAELDVEATFPANTLTRVEVFTR